EGSGVGDVGRALVAGELPRVAVDADRLPFEVALEAEATDIAAHDISWLGVNWWRSLSPTTGSIQSRLPEWTIAKLRLNSTSRPSAALRREKSTVPAKSRVRSTALFQ